MPVVASTMLDFGRIVLKLYFYFFRFYNHKTKVFVDARFLKMPMDLEFTLNFLQFLQDPLISGPPENFTSLRFAIFIHSKYGGYFKPKVKPLTKQRRVRRIRRNTGPVMIIDAAEILPQLIYAQEYRLTDATGRVFADPGAKTRAKIKSFHG